VKGKYKGSFVLSESAMKDDWQVVFEAQGGVSSKLSIFNLILDGFPFRQKPNISMSKTTSFCHTLSKSNSPRKLQSEIQNSRRKSSPRTISANLLQVLPLWLSGRPIGNSFLARGFVVRKDIMRNVAEICSIRLSTSTLQLKSST
jgi:hypothetical protein